VVGVYPGGKWGWGDARGGYRFVLTFSSHVLLFLLVGTSSYRGYS